MNKQLLAVLVGGVALFASVEANASLLAGSASFSGSGSYNGDLNILIDKVIPDEGTQWQTSTVWWEGLAPSFTMDYGAVVRVEDLLLSLDNNDSYKVSYSSDNVSWTELFTVQEGQGNVGWGMDTFSTNASADASLYVNAFDFSAIEARYIKIAAIGGDNMYSIGEIQASGSPVPVPSAMLLLSVGCSALALISRKRRIN
jgi:hypothetical protein